MKKFILLVLVVLFAVLAVAFVTHDTAQVVAESLYLFANDNPIGSGGLPPSFRG